MDKSLQLTFLGHPVYIVQTIYRVDIGHIVSYRYRQEKYRNSRRTAHETQNATAAIRFSNPDSWASQESGLLNRIAAKI